MFALNDLPARFVTFAQAADCAVVHARQRGECVIRYRSGPLLACFRKEADGTVAVMGVCEGKAMVEAWAD